MTLSLTVLIIIATLFVSLKGFSDQNFLHQMAFSPYDVKHHNKQFKFITHIFIHADWSHFLFNMFSLYMFGDLLEKELRNAYGITQGNFHFFVIYFVGGLFATLWPMIRNQNNPNYLSLGASGAVSSVIFAVVLWYPSLPMGIIFLPGIYIPAYIFGPLYLAFEFYAFRKGRGNIAHDAHIGGAFFGIIYILIINIDKAKSFYHLIFG
jgi:membrane associated rhomboid family serine protease